MSKLKWLMQHLLPHRALSVFAGWMANSSIPWLKNILILDFLKRYPVNMAEAQIEDPRAYASYNDFFTRRLKPALRPVDAELKSVISPVDGVVSECGLIEKDRLLQAKGHRYTLGALLADQDEAALFHDGAFATLYLAPHDYHRVHMPLVGQLIKTMYVPGSLFSVSALTTEQIPNLFARNERLVALFETAVGRMAVIFVGAMLVGSIVTAWSSPKKQKRMNRRCDIDYRANHLHFNKGDDIGCFELGSTVIVLLPAGALDCGSLPHAGAKVRFGQRLATLS
jgi:phosphatidylserine decarboxylase